MTDVRTTAEETESVRGREADGECRVSNPQSGRRHPIAGRFDRCADYTRSGPPYTRLHGPQRTSVVPVSPAVAIMTLAQAHASLDGLIAYLCHSDSFTIAPATQ
jgi:hypothetical protein